MTKTEYSIEAMEKIIKARESMGKDASYEKRLVKAWKRQCTSVSTIE